MPVLKASMAVASASETGSPIQRRMSHGSSAPMSHARKWKKIDSARRLGSRR
jgi:hypothetical protein